MTNKKLNLQKRKEKKYYSRLNGEYREAYEKVRNPNISINKNKKSVKKYIQSHPESIFDIEIKFPKLFDIYNQKNSKKTIRICNKISSSSGRIFIDIRGVELLSAAASALLISSIYKSISNKCIIKCNYPKLRKSEAVLQKIGFFEALSKENRLPDSIVNNFNDVNCWFIYRDTKFDSETILNIVHDFACSKLDKIANEPQISKNSMENIEKSIKELIANIVEHAYPEDYGFDKHWVLFAKYNEDNDTLVLVLSDSGKTIPNTFLHYHKDNPNLLEKIKGKAISDTTLIKSAIKFGRSGTDREGRGNGLPFVRKSINDFGGNMIIYSKKGCYIPSKSEYYGKAIKIYEQINGTIVNIQLPLQSLRSK